MDRRTLLQLLGLSGGAFIILPPHILGRARDNVTSREIREALQRLEGEPGIRAEVRVERGGPRLFVNDEEIFAVLGMSADGLLRTAKGYTLSGFDYFSPIIGLNATWKSPGVYDFRTVEEYLATLLIINPRARFLPRLQLNVPQWWKDAHPDQLVRYGLPYPEEEYHMKEILAEAGFNIRAGRDLQDVSLASALWKREMGDLLHSFLRFFMESPLKSRIIGYELVHAKTSEWHYIGSRYLPDYSEVFKSVVNAAPTPKQRMNPEFGLFRDPSQERKVIDFYRRYHQNTAETILHFARIAKNATEKRVIIGTFYTYLLENVMIQEAGHLAPEPVLQSPHIDYLASPYTYMRSNMPGKKHWESDVVDDSGNWLGRARGVGGDGGFRILLESLKRHCKLFFSECDPSTYLEPARTTEGGSGYDTVAGTLRILERDLGNIFALGTAGWFLDFGILPEELGSKFKAGRGWYDDPPMHELFQKLLKTGQSHIDTDISSVSEIAAVYDAKSFFVTNHWKQEEPYKGFGISITDMVNHWFLNAQARSLHRIGAPVDFLYRFDLVSDDTTRYRLLFMVNLFYLTEEEVDHLRDLLWNSGATAVWYYAPGFVTPEQLDLKQMERLTGFTFAMETSPAPLLIRCHLPNEGEAVEMQIGIRKSYYPRFSVAGPDDTIVLGRWTDSGDIAFAARQDDGWRSVYVGAGPLPSEVLRWLAQTAGCHTWCNKPDVIRAVRDRLMIVAQDDGERTLSLPYPLAPVDGGTPSKGHRLSMKFGEVRLFSGLVPETGGITMGDLGLLAPLTLAVVEASRVRPGQSVAGEGPNTTGGTLVRPGGRDAYAAFWIRDFALSLESGLISPEELEHAVRLTARLQASKDWETPTGSFVPRGSIADHVTLDGSPIFFPGTNDPEAQGQPWGYLPSLDDNFFFVEMAWQLARLPDRVGILISKIDGRSLLERLDLAFSATQASEETGLVWCDEGACGVSFGFTDVVVHTGELLFCSILRHRAASQLADLHEQAGNREKADRYRSIAQKIRRNVPKSFSHESGLLRAATGRSGQPDVWGSAYAVYTGVLDAGKSEEVCSALHKALLSGTISWRGNIRHVPTTYDYSNVTAWEKTVNSCPKNRYQNGAYWGTPTGWVCFAVAQVDEPAARKLAMEYLEELRLGDFRQGGEFGSPYECIHPDGDYRNNPVYMTSVACPLGAFRRLGWITDAANRE